MAQFHVVLGPVKTEFKLLGIQYLFGSLSTCVNADSLHKKIVERCRKIRIAAKTMRMRKLLVDMVVLSSIKWTGPWQSYNKCMLNDWCIAIETAIWDSPPCPGRSPYLFWSVAARLSCNPIAALDVETLQQEWRRQCSRNAGLPVPDRPSRHADAILKQLDWQISESGVWVTPCGQLRAGWVSDSTFRKFARLSWARVCYNQDRKFSTLLQKDHEPYLGFLYNVVLEGGPAYKTRNAMAAATDARVLARKQVEETCDCGEPCPDRTHLTCSCQACVQPPPSRSVDENRMLVPLVVFPAHPPCTELTPNPKLVEFLKLSFEKSGQPPILGVDGSCLVSPKNIL